MAFYLFCKNVCKQQVDGGKLQKRRGKKVPLLCLI